MAIRSLNPAKLYTKREIEAYFDSHPAVTGSHQAGSHKTYQGPHGSVTITTGAGEMPRGTLRAILRLAALAGLGVLVLALIAALF